MSVDKFKFISPGIFVSEIDNTGRGRTPDDVGPVLIGRSEKGPILEPTKVTSYEDFVNLFGRPIPGGNAGDVPREGNYTSPTYAAYAAQAWLRNSSPVTYVRLGGQAHGQASEDTDGALAGWKTSVLTASKAVNANGQHNGGAFGLFVYGHDHGATFHTGTLAAVFYMESSKAIGLSGSTWNTEEQAEPSKAPGDKVLKGNRCATAAYFKATGDQEFRLVIGGNNSNTAAKPELDVKFNFTETSEHYIRKVFNTNPILTNSDATDSDHTEAFWLGESFDGAARAALSTPQRTAGGGFNAMTHIGAILPLTSGSTKSHADRRKDYQRATSGWFIAQDLTDATGSFLAENQQKLFKVHARNAGSWSSKNLKISIKDIKASNNTIDEHGTFTLAVRNMRDTDNRVEYLEQFNNLNLNPNSENYIARRIGNTHFSWDDTDRRYKEFGDYPNLSNYIRIEMNDTVDKGDTDNRLLPFGVLGPPVYNDFHDGSIANVGATFVSGGAVNPFKGSVTLATSATDNTYLTLISGSQNTEKVRFQFPRLRLRVSASEGDPANPKNVFWGVDTTFNSNRYDRSVGDHLKVLSRDSSSDFETHSFAFTLQDMCNTAKDQSLSGSNVYVSGSRQMRKKNKFIDEVEKTLQYITGSYTRIIREAGCDRFTTVLHGGFDGLDITECEPFRNNLLETGTEKTNYAINSIRVAIDSIRDPERVEYNIAAMPGIKNNNLNRSLVDMCEERGDALAVIDIKHGYTSKYETTSAETAAGIIGDVNSAVKNVKNELLLNSSYGATYYPWVLVRDTHNGQLVWTPPSVAAIGAMSYGQRTSELWFAPAGFTRGRLSDGSAGLPVVAVREKLTKKQRDKLYDANINPIADIPAEGIVIYGQKTLQLTQSSLNRINVRRMLIFVKRQISRYAATVLFDQNVRTTWNRFRSRVEPFLAGVKAGLGIEKFKLVLDETTTTEDLIDQNIMYAKIFIKPARAIEYIALDFILTDNGAAFED